MYKIIKNNTSTMASYESKKEAYNAILSILFEITKNVPANSIEMIYAKGRLDFLIDGKLFAFYQIVEFDANAVNSFPVDTRLYILCTSCNFFRVLSVIFPSTFNPYTF